MRLRSVAPEASIVGVALLASLLTVWNGGKRSVPHEPTEARESPSATSTRARVRIGLVFDVGGRGDKSFNDGAYAGLLRAEKELGADVAYLEPAGSEDREAAMRLFAARGMDLILGIGFIFSSDVNAVAKDYPDRKFACVDYAPGPGPMPSNVQGLVFRDEEGAFLVGAVAGLLTKSKHVGFVGGMQNPLIRKFEAGYEQGVQETCKECVVHGAYAGATPDAFRDPARGKSLAAAQIAEGADVLFHASGATGHGVFEGARDGRALAIGVDADQFDEMPGTVVTSMLKRVDVAVFEAIANVLQGRFQPGMAVFGVREGAIDYVHEGPHAVGLTSSLKERLETLKKAIAQGQIHVRRE